MLDPDVCQLLQIMSRTRLNTSPVESEYTYSQMLAAKRRNRLSKKNIETLFLLAALKLPAKNKNNYEQEIKLVQEKL